MPDPVREIFSSEAAYQQAIDKVMNLARHRLRAVDIDGRGLQWERRHALLAELLARHVEVQLLLRDAGFLQRDCPHLIKLMQVYSHQFHVRCAIDAQHLPEECWVLADADHGVIRFHPDHARGKLLTDNPQDIEPCLNLWNLCWDAAQQSVSATVLGL